MKIGGGFAVVVSAVPVFVAVFRGPVIGGGFAVVVSAVPVFVAVFRGPVST